ncbi:MAG TPA: FmdB family zinc ribbon protein [Gemmatimonadales bacterium]|jgi:putative FmdB family regulatory protein|nr:FmdB family zinc ribbon protein [Gemmatimonadales bacterium]
MPTYEYQCPEGHLFDKFQKINDKPRAKCPVCGKAAVRKISGGAGLLFKGSGFYITDYGKDGKGPRKPEADSAPTSESKTPDAKADSSKQETKPAAKADSPAPKTSRPGKGKAAPE